MIPFDLKKYTSVLIDKYKTGRIYISYRIERTGQIYIAECLYMGKINVELYILIVNKEANCAYVYLVD